MNSNGGEGWKRCELGEDERRGVVDRGAQGGRRRRLKSTRRKTRELVPDKGGRRQIKEEVEAVRN